jgi:hypothetical protein
MLPLYIRQGTCHFDELWLLSSASAGVKWLCEGTVWRLPLVVEENVSRYIVSCLDYAREHEDGRVFTQRRRVRWRATADQPTHFFRHISPTSKCSAPQHSCLSLFIGACEIVDLFGLPLGVAVTMTFFHGHRPRARPDADHPLCPLTGPTVDGCEVLRMMGLVKIWGPACGHRRREIRCPVSFFRLRCDRFRHIELPSKTTTKIPSRWSASSTIPRSTAVLRTPDLSNQLTATRLP